jgi:hypothetical protein
LRWQGTHPVTASGSGIGGGEEWLAPSNRKAADANRDPFDNLHAIERSRENLDCGLMIIKVWPGTIEVLRKAEEISEKP